MFMSKLDDILKKSKVDLLKLENVVGVGKGFKVQKGLSTNRESIVVLVRKKIPKEELKANQLVPIRILEIETDVIEVGELRFFNLRTNMVRPAQPGMSIGSYRITAGTFGAVVYDKKTKRELILSNNHVLANSSDGQDSLCQIGDAIYQPGAYDGGTPIDLIGHLERFVPIHKEFNQATCPIALSLEKIINSVIKALRPHYQISLFKKSNTLNYVDAALATPLRDGMVDPTILEIGKVKGKRSTTAGMNIQKSGRSSGLTKGIVQAVDVTTKVAYDHNSYAIFHDQIVATPMALPGDSGSLVLDEENYAIGLLFAGSDLSTVINKIDLVLSLLNIELKFAK
jgi:hypothetical protein